MTLLSSEAPKVERDQTSPRIVNSIPETSPLLAYRGPEAFHNLIFDCTHEALTELLSTRAREAIFDYLERNCSVGRSEIPEHLDDLLKVLDLTLGRGSKTIGRVIAKKIYSKLEWQFEDIPDLDLTDYLERIGAKITRELMDRARLSADQGSVPDS